MVCTTLSSGPKQHPHHHPHQGSDDSGAVALDMSSTSSLRAGHHPHPHLNLHHHQLQIGQNHQAMQQQQQQEQQQQQHNDDQSRSSSAASSMGSCSPPPSNLAIGGHNSSQSASPPPQIRPPWLHDFAPPHVLQFLNLSAAGAAAGAGMLAASQPLAALHSMAERSHQHQQHQQQQQNLAAAAAAAVAHLPQQAHLQHQQHGTGGTVAVAGQNSPTGSGKHSPATSITSVGSNPHGIDTILSRPTAIQQNQSPVIGANPHAQHLATAPRYAMHAGFAATTGIGQFQQRTEPRHPAIYWPGLQGLVSDPLAWRARLHSLSQQLGCQQAMSGSGSGAGSDHDGGKKKHTRPTFSGQQIFALEKTFEQTKYLAGPERAKLAYALGMTESQVKVWFQNRRTKWRKKHAAEMATAKRRQEEVEGVVGESEDVCSDGDVSEHGSANGSSGNNNNNNNNSTSAETAARRLRREMEQGYVP